MTGRVFGKDCPGGARAGIAGIAVSDGLHVTRTDASGRYVLEVDPRRRRTTLVNITVPTGWQAPRHPSGTLAFFRSLTDAAAGAEDVDFDLLLDSAGQSASRFVALADPHVKAGTISNTQTCRRQIERINRLVRDLADDPPSFLVVAGDLTNDATAAELRDYLDATAASAIPVWSAPGNHDLAGRVPGGPQPRAASELPYRDAIEGYRSAIGPEWYSFQHGGNHFVVLENYRGVAERDQLAWLKQDLALNADDKQVAVIAHVPWDVPQTPDTSLTHDYERLFEVYDVRLLLAGHTHANEVVRAVVGRAVQVVTTSPAYALDQTPRGFRLVDLGEAVSTRFVEFDTDPRATVVHPVGTVGRVGEVRVDRYRPPGEVTQVEWRLPPHPWRPLHAQGPRSWVASLDVAEPAGAARQLLIRSRDRPSSPWSEQTVSFTLAPGAAPPPRQGAPWPMFHRDARHTGVSPDVVAPPLRIAWVRRSGGTVLTSSPSVAHESVFIGTRDEDSDEGNGVAALNLATGERRWRVDAESAVEGTVAVHGDLVLAAAVKGPLRALHWRTGSERWRWSPGERCWMYFSPTVAGRTVYQAYSVPSGGAVVALDAITGVPQWRTAEPIGRNWISHGSPAVAGDQLVFATAYANLVSLDAYSGAVRWQVAFGGWTRSMPVLTDDLVLLACQGDRLLAVEATSGRLRWCHQPSPAHAQRQDLATAATPAVADGVVYGAFADGSIKAIRIDSGELIWCSETGATVISSPAVSGDYVYVGSNDGWLRALCRHRGECVWSHQIGCWIASSPAVTGNTLVIAAWDGNVYAFTNG